MYQFVADHWLDFFKFNDSFGKSFVFFKQLNSDNSQQKAPHLDELEWGEGGGAVVRKHEADDAHELSVETAVAQTQQETAQHGHAHTEPQRKTNK